MLLAKCKCIAAVKTSMVLPEEGNIGLEKIHVSSVPKNIIHSSKRAEGIHVPDSG